ncbi:hypothetical protein [Minwuia thermotolerans]|uniref:Transglycosylase SLT domain-containing protein n=1 Tax=Minwuia thermotolerans TaxID=2056226 RepID=A0A2M9G2P6_9PROT|nr:hypothetical protein [Minwuia thermotolerans]PJK29975.1 hypothetical protein CVT23_09415 [Minwuia thermotolerans]
MDTSAWAREVRDHVIWPTLDWLGPPFDDLAAVQLICMTDAHESWFVHLRQVARFDAGRPVFGPARGLGQMEPPTLADNLNWARRAGGVSRTLWEKLQLWTGGHMPADRLMGDMVFATIAARIHYWRRPEALPAAGDVDGLAGYAKKYWNTHLGAATEADYADAFRTLFPPTAWRPDRIFRTDLAAT